MTIQRLQAARWETGRGRVRAPKPTSSFADTVLIPGGVQTVFQPIVRFSASGWTVHALECLSRGPKGTPYESACALFAAARAAGVEVEVDHACVDAAFRTIERERIVSDIFVNVDALTMVKDAGFPTFLAAMAAGCEIAWSRITVEITEHDRGRDVARLSEACGELHRLGARVAFDDFGPEAADDRALAACRPDVVKIDGPLLNAGRRSLPARQVAERVVGRAREFGAQIVAEGLEQAADLYIAAQFGIDLLQGHLLCEALGADSAVFAQERVDQRACN